MITNKINIFPEDYIDIKEYWKITEFRKALELLNSQGGKGNITRNEGVDIKIKINLMEEAEEFGRKSQKQKIIEEIEKIRVMITKRWIMLNPTLVNNAYVEMFAFELLKSINSQDVKLIDKVSPEDKAKVNVIATASLGDVSGCPDKTLGEKDENN